MLDQSLRQDLVDAWRRAEHWSPKTIRDELDAALKALRDFENMVHRDEPISVLIVEAETCRTKMRKATRLAIETLNARLAASAA